MYSVLFMAGMNAQRWEFSPGGITDEKKPFSHIYSLHIGFHSFISKIKFSTPGTANIEARGSKRDQKSDVNLMQNCLTPYHIHISRNPFSLINPSYFIKCI